MLGTWLSLMTAFRAAFRLAFAHTFLLRSASLHVVAVIYFYALYEIALLGAVNDRKETPKCLPLSYYCGAYRPRSICHWYVYAATSVLGLGPQASSLAV